SAASSARQIRMPASGRRKISSGSSRLAVTTRTKTARLALTTRDDRSPARTRRAPAVPAPGVRDATRSAPRARPGAALDSAAALSYGSGMELLARWLIAIGAVVLLGGLLLLAA